MSGTLGPLRSLGAALALADVVGGAAGQRAPGTPAPVAEAQPEPLGETVHVDVVNVDVMVTDAKGEPVLGLSREDFEVFEDGRRVPLTNFFSYAAADRPAAEPGTAPPAPPAVETLAPAAAERALHVVVYIDNLNIRPLNRNRLFGRLREFLLGGLPAGARVMLVTADRTARIQQPFTTEPALVASALDAVERMSGQGLAADAERNDIIRRMEEAETPETVVLRLRQYARGLDNDVTFALEALKKLIDPLAGLPGRKALVHVSDGIPTTPGEDLFWAMQEKFPETSILNEARAFDGTRKLEELAAAANSARITIYALDAAGLRVHASSDVSRRQSALDRLSPTMDALWVSNLQGSIRLLAEKTGGLAIVNTNDAGPGLARVADDFRAQYSLGFRAEHGGDGRYHRLEVRVRGEGLNVRHRDGYRDKSPAARMSDGTTSVLLFGGGENPLGLTVEPGPQRRRDDGDVEATLLLSVPFSRLVLLPRGEDYEGRLEVFVQVMDSDGGQSPISQSSVPLRLPRQYFEAAQTERFTYELPLLMRPGQHIVAVGMRDELAAASTFVRRHVAVEG